MVPLASAADAVRIGASFGNEACYIRTTPAAGLDHLYVAATGRWYFGRAEVRPSEAGELLPQTRAEFGPVAQGAVFESRGLVADIMVFVPPGTEARAYFWIRLYNGSASKRRVRIEGEGIFAAVASAMHRQQPRQRDIERIFTAVESSHETVLQVRAPQGERLSVQASAGRILPGREKDTWTWRVSATLAPRGHRKLWLCLTVRADDETLPSPDGLPAIRAADWQCRRDETDALITVPDNRIDDAVVWAKFNTRRVCHQYARGAGFTNDPPGSILVTRDVAWFTFGADWFRPQFCRRILDALTALAPYPDGKIAEYLDLNTAPVFRSDYDLNIADPTPLYLLAIHHHAVVTGDIEWLAGVYPTVRAAAGYLIAQVRDGLVVCTSRDARPGAGQCGWRNVLDGIRITGATAELQAESIAALTACAEMAGALGEPTEAAAFERTAETLRTALHTRLVDPLSGRFRLALDPDDPDGIYGRDDTLDQVFPLLFELADDDLARRTVEHVLREPYCTSWGLRTVPAGAPQYHPHAQWGLIGGVWPNATAWAAAAIAPYAADDAWRLASLIARTVVPDRRHGDTPDRDTIDRISIGEVRPFHPFTPSPVHPFSLSGARVPGQFAEWFDGETGVSKGMALSSWMPPTYIWLIVERLLGIRPSFAGLRVHPRLHAEWPSVFASQLRYRGGVLTLIINPDSVRSTHDLVACDRTVERFR